MKTSFKTLIHTAPDTVKDRIFAQLDKPSKLIARTVCKRWKVLVDKTIEFRVFLTTDTYRFVENFGKKRTINELIVGFFSQSYPQNGWKLSIQALKILADYRYEVFYEGSNGSENQPALAMVVMPETKLQLLFKEFKNISKLTLSSMAVVDIKRHSFLEEMQFSNLKTLDITGESEFGLDALRDLLSNNFRKLRAFSLTTSNDDDMTLYQEMYSFIGKHNFVKILKCDYLRTPAIHHSDLNNNEEVQGIMNLHRDQKLEPVAYANVLQDLGTVALNYVDIYILSSEGRARKNLALHMLQAQEVLTTLHLYNLRVENYPVWRTVPSILSKCSATLKSLILDGCFCDHLARDPPGPFSGKWVKPCSHLKKLEFMVCGVKITDLPKFPKCITTLFLGHLLSSSQIKYILNNFQQLEELSLPQAQVPMSEVGNPQISLSNFQDALQLPKLTKLTLSTKTCKYRQIRKFAASLIGILENGQETLQVETKRGDVEYLIDRDLFVPPVSS